MMVGTLNSRCSKSGTPPQKHQSVSVNGILSRVLVANLAVAAAKIMVGLLTGSISMVADGFHSVTDASSNVIGLVGSALANRPPDHDHPYGHHKYETFATLGIGLLLLLTSWNILKSVFTRLLEGSAPEVTALSFGVMIITILVNLAVTIYERRKGQQLNSAILLADAEHTRSDIYVSLSVIGSLLAVWAGWPWLDAAIALVIVAVIAHTGWQIVRQASDILADSAVVDAVRVAEIACSIQGVHSCHKIRSRGSSQAAHLDLHIQVDNHLTIEAAHRLGHLAKSRLQRELGLVDVMVHVEPVKKPRQI